MYFELGARKAKEHLWTGEYIDAHEALRLGIVNRVVPNKRLEEETMKLASRIALLDTWGLMASKIAINQAEDIMGKTAAIKASCNFWTMSRSRRDPKVWAVQYDVDWVKNRDKDFHD